MKMQFVYHNDGLQTKETSPKFSLREKGRLFSIKNDGTDSYPFIIKKDAVLFGSGLTCDIRIHVVGVAEEHCSIVIVPNGKAYLNPLAVSESTYLNDLNVSGKVILLHNDLITIGNRRFRFQYPSGSSLTQFLSYEDDGMKLDCNRKVNSAKSLLLLNSKRQSLPSRASDVKKGVRFGIKRKSLDFSDSTARKSLRRRVTFGPRLSPEEFDKRLPPASPLRRGSLPNRKASILNAAKHKIAASAAAPQDKRFKHCKALKLKFSPKCSSNSVVTPVNDKGGSEDAKEKGPTAAKRLLFSEVLKKPVPIDDLCQKLAPCAQSAQNKPKVLNVPADKCVKKLERGSIQKNLQQSLILKKFGITSTGHANSPATILISKTKRAASKESSDCGSSADFIGTEASSCPESSINYNHPLTAEICMLENSDSFSKDGTSGISSQEARPSGKLPVKCTSSKSTPLSSPSFPGESNSNKAAEKSRSSSNEGHVRHTNEESEKEFDSREAIKSLIFNSSLVSEISNNFGESSSGSNCIDVVKQVVFALSMANAYHDYKNIIEDIIHSPQSSSLNFEAMNKPNSSPDEAITDNQEESSLKDLIKKNRIFLQLVQKYQPKLLSKEIQDLLKDCETSKEFSPGPPGKVKRTSCANLSSRRSFKKRGRKGSRFRKKSSVVKKINLQCSPRADCDSELNLAEPKLKSPRNLSLLGNETVESASKGESSERQKISTSPSDNQNVKLQLRSKHLRSDEKLVTITRRLRSKVSLGNKDLSKKLRRRTPVSRRLSKVHKLKKRTKPDHFEEGSAKKSCLDQNDSALLQGEPKTMSPTQTRTSGMDPSLVQSSFIDESFSEVNTPGVQEMKPRSKIRAKRKNEPEATEQNDALSLQRKSLKRKYSLRAVMLKGRKSVSTTDKRKRRKSSVAKQLIATAKRRQSKLLTIKDTPSSEVDVKILKVVKGRRRKSSVANQLIATAKKRQSKLLTIKDSPSSEVDVKILKVLKGRRRKVQEIRTPKTSTTKPRKRTNSLVKKDATSDRAIKKIAFEDDPEKNLKLSEGTPARGKISTPTRNKMSTPARSKMSTPARSKMSTPARSKISTPARSKISTPANSKTQLTVKSAELTNSRTPGKKRKLRTRNIENESSLPIEKEAPATEHLSPTSKIIKKSPSKVVTGKTTRARTERGRPKSKDASVELKSPVKIRRTKKTEGIEKLSSDTKAVENIPSRPSPGKRKKASVTTRGKRRNLKSKEAASVENLNDDSTKEAEVEILPSKTKAVRKRKSKGKDSVSEKRVLPKRMSPEKRVTRSTRRKVSEGKKK